jgi:hypothetical protein
LQELKHPDSVVHVFDSGEAFRILGEPLDGLTRAELEQRVARNRRFTAWIDEREAHLRAVLGGREAGK